MSYHLDPAVPLGGHLKLGTLYFLSVILKLCFSIGSLKPKMAHKTPGFLVALCQSLQMFESACELSLACEGVSPA